MCRGASSDTAAPGNRLTRHYSEDGFARPEGYVETMAYPIFANDPRARREEPTTSVRSDPTSMNLPDGGPFERFHSNEFLWMREGDWGYPWEKIYWGPTITEGHPFNTYEAGDHVWVMSVGDFGDDWVWGTVQEQPDNASNPDCPLVQVIVTNQWGEPTSLTTTIYEYVRPYLMRLNDRTGTWEHPERPPLPYERNPAAPPPRTMRPMQPALIFPIQTHLATYAARAGVLYWPDNSSSSSSSEYREAEETYTTEAHAAPHCRWHTSESGQEWMSYDREWITRNVDLEPRVWAAGSSNMVGSARNVAMDPDAHRH